MKNLPLMSSSFFKVYMKKHADWHGRAISYLGQEPYYNNTIRYLRPQVP